LNLNFNFSTPGFTFNPPSAASGFSFTPSSAAAGLSPELQQPLVQAISEKLSSIVGASSGYIESLPQAVKNRVHALNNLHAEYTDLEKLYEEEVLRLQLKYYGLYKPIFEKRAAIVKGIHEPAETQDVDTKTSAEAGMKEGAEEKPKDTDSATSKEEPKGIPQFWLTVLRSHGLFDAAITEKDEEALRYLEDVMWEPLPDEPKSFVLRFYFGENPCFEDSVLTKTYSLKGDSGEALMCDDVKATTIRWKEGKDLTKGATALGDALGSFFLFLLSARFIRKRCLRKDDARSSTGF